MNLNELLKQYLNEIKTTKSHNSYLTYKNALNVWFKTGNVEITLPYITEIISTWQCSQNSKVLRCRILKKFIDYCKYFDVEFQDLAPIIEILNGFKPKEIEPEYVSKEQYKKLMETCTSDRLRVCIQLMYENGLRSDEVLNIKSNDYNYESKNIIIRNTKNGNDYSILVTDNLNENLKMIFDFSSEYLIHSRSGQRIANSNFRKEVKELCIKAGYPKLHCHSFRHGSAMFLLDNKVSVFLIQKHLRHKSIQSTQKYLHYTNEQKQEINELFSQI